MFLTRSQALAYQYIFKPIAFRFDPEDVHDRVTHIGRWMGNHSLTRSLAHKLWSYAHPSLEQDVLGIHFPNPVGLTAGFDKDGYLTDILPDVGFGFAEIGSITTKPCAGNPKPRLWRLPEIQSLVVFYGLKNEGVTAVHARLENKTFRIPIGISIAKTNCMETCSTEKGIEDYGQSMKTMADLGDYLTINISCPNAYGGEPFTVSPLLERLLSNLDPIETTKPLFLKMPSDLTFSALDALIEIATRHRVHGLILTNLAKKQNGKGGLSGKSVQHISDVCVGHVYKTAGKRFVIVGTGGIFSGEDAYHKIRQGASLVQLATGMIFQGPQLIGDINRKLVKLLLRDGFKNISEAVGANHR